MKRTLIECGEGLKLFKVERDGKPTHYEIIREIRGSLIYWIKFKELQDYGLLKYLRSMMEPVC